HSSKNFIPEKFEHDHFIHNADQISINKKSRENNSLHKRNISFDQISRNSKNEISIDRLSAVSSSLSLDHPISTVDESTIEFSNSSESTSLKLYSKDLEMNANSKDRRKTTNKLVSSHKKKNRSCVMADHLQNNSKTFDHKKNVRFPRPINQDTLKACPYVSYKQINTLAALKEIRSFNTESSKTFKVEKEPLKMPLKKPNKVFIAKKSLLKRDQKLLTGIKEGIRNISVKDAIKEADYYGWMRKKTDRYGQWKPLFFCLTGTRLSYFYSEDVKELQQLTIPQLRVIAIKCGILNNGNKLVLIHRILEEISKIRLISKHCTTHRILSIDVGIRNLALCSISVPSTIIQDFNLNYHKQFIIDDWDKLSIGLEKIENNKVVKETYKPVDYSFLTYQLTKSFLEKYKPKTILIECQRYRTRTKNVIQEWTIRVNMFENMLHAIFRCFKEEKIWNDPEANILSIDPAKIASFLFGKNNILKQNPFANYDLFKNILIASTNEGLIDLSETSNLKYKKKKIELVDLLLKTDSIFDFKNTQITIRDFISRKKEKNKLKVDDLADSLLQGLSWIIWERNKWCLRQKLQDNEPLCDFINN
ncbi:hypothetical protein PCK1_001734, partial [Pneumocystis canis]